ncbi:hypothetical protein I317_00428 [Kwoniella heveanensis CBS 569]|uniref:Uncharacterized protein n=1 Tax=Kwoniella heveanensis BCC8398 TaxID=1296120 RepID=A0A1B9GXZ5_9TREE|nr:hypothetical protein I316_02402 [Kwoniella heveanensis BCC8398]OCF45526.1 hypothetical protein I317_00428 [Kwoniella heveanensis CBS 569]
MSSTISDLFGGTPTTATDAEAASAASASSTQGLFPTQANAGDNRNRGPNVYYLVFLGILVILMMIAGCLAIRAIRVRRRYRTATQLALARGDPIPGGEAYWGLGGLGNWTPDGFDRLGNVERELRRRERERKNKMPVPVLFESEVHQSRDLESVQERMRVREGYGMARGEELDGLFDAEPVSVQSLRPPDAEPPTSRQPIDSTPAQSPRPRPGHIFSFRQHLASLQLPHTPSTPDVVLPEDREAQAESRRKEVENEMDRDLRPGERVRVAFIVQMPTRTADQGSDANGLRGRTNRSAWASDEDERVGWEEGMELGVWEGRLGPLPPEGSLRSDQAGWRKRASFDADSLE